MKKIGYTLLLLLCITLFWHTKTIKEEQCIRVDTLSGTLKQKEEQIKKWKQLAIKKDKKYKELLEENERLRTIRAKVTAYAPLDNKSGICADNNPTVTSTGTFPKKGVIAVDPKEIPYFTKVEIPGYGIASAEDTGGALRNYEGVAIDVLVDTHEEAMEWGVQYLDVKIQ